MRVRVVGLWLFLSVGLVGCGASFGKRPRAAEKKLFPVSEQFDGKRFRNSEPMYNTWWFLEVLFGRSSHRIPKSELPVVPVKPSRFRKAPESGLRVTWLGHSTVLIEIEGKILLTDPVWSKRTSPYQWIGPKRWYEPPLPLDELPKLDAVLLSHDHYDHLDYETIVALKDRKTRFIAPLGVGSHLRYWGVGREKITETDWWDEVDLGGLIVACVPARHASGRRLAQEHTLWGGFALIGAEHRVYFSGDTGMFPGFFEIGERYGPFDLTMIEAGAYGKYWPDWHLGPEQAVVAHQMVRGKFLLPIHWGLVDLAAHGWTEPIERVLRRAHDDGVSVATPRPGQSIQPADVAKTERWWPDVPWQTAEESPIIATENGDKKKRFDLNELRLKSRRSRSKR